MVVASDQSEWVYVISDGSGLVKVGRSRQPDKRLAALICQSARLDLRIVKRHDCRRFAGHVEAAILRDLTAHRLVGEWFRVDQAVAIASMHAAVARYVDRMAAHGLSIKPDLDVAPDHRLAAILRTI